MYPAWLFLPGYLSMLSKTALICSISYGLMSSWHACFISFLIHFTFYASVFFLSFKPYFFLNISDSCRILSYSAWSKSVLGAEFIVPEFIPAATADPCMWPSKRQQEKCAFRAILVLIFLCAGGNRQTLGRNLRKQKGVPGINFPWKNKGTSPPCWGKLEVTKSSVFWGHRPDSLESKTHCAMFHRTRASTIFWHSFICVSLFSCSDK